jgi:transcriptional regulator with XRE-family HTH domain
MKKGFNSELSDEAEARWRAFGVWFKNERELVGKTQEDIAAETGIHVKTISRIENGAPTKRGTVQVLAKSVNASMNNALARAGFLLEAPTPSKPQTVAELVERLNDMGFPIQLDADIDHLGPDDLQDIMEDIEAKILYKARKK